MRDPRLLPKIVFVALPDRPDAADLLAHQHEPAGPTRRSCPALAFWPHHPTLEKYIYIFNDPTWVHAFGVSLTYVAINTVISVTVALPAAYAFNRYHFIGDKHLFFWLLSNLMAPAAVFAMPFFNLYYADRPVRHGLGGGAGALPVQRAAGGVDSRRLRRRRAARDRRDGGDRRLFVPALLHSDLPAADRQRHRRHRVLLLHVLLGRAVAGDDADVDRRAAVRGGDDPQPIRSRAWIGRCSRRRAC